MFKVRVANIKFMCIGVKWEGTGREHGNYINLHYNRVDMYMYISTYFRQIISGSSLDRFGLFHGNKINEISAWKDMHTITRNPTFSVSFQSCTCRFLSLLVVLVRMGRLIVHNLRAIDSPKSADSTSSPVDRLKRLSCGTLGWPAAIYLQFPLNR